MEEDACSIGVVGFRAAARRVVARSASQALGAAPRRRRRSIAPELAAHATNDYLSSHVWRR